MIYQSFFFSLEKVGCVLLCTEFVLIVCVFSVNKFPVQQKGKKQLQLDAVRMEKDELRWVSDDYWQGLPTGLQCYHDYNSLSFRASHPFASFFFFYIFFLLEDQGVAHITIHIPLLQLLNQSKGFKRYYLPLANKGSTFLILDFCSFTCKFCLNPHHWSRHLEKKKKKVVKPLEEQTFVV